MTTMTTGQALAAIAVMAVVTFLTRALPFLLFDRGGEPPKVVLYLGRVLPPAVIAMLIVYCLKGVSFATPAGWVPALLASAAALELGEVAVETLRKGRNTEAQSGLDGIWEYRLRPVQAGYGGRPLPGIPAQSGLSGSSRSVQRDGRPHLLWEGGPLSGAGPL